MSIWNKIGLTCIIIIIKSYICEYYLFMYVQAALMFIPFLYIYIYSPYVGIFNFFIYMCVCVCVCVYLCNMIW